MGKGAAGDGVAEAGLGVAFVEETSPKTKVQFGHHAAGRDAFALVQKFLPGVGQLVLLPRRQIGNDIIPRRGFIPRGKKMVEGIAQGDFGHLQRRIETFAQGHVPKITGKRGGRRHAVLPVGIKALRGENGFDRLEKCEIHACNFGTNKRLFPR